MAEHILIIRFSALGDVAMLVPVVRSLAHQYPDVRITVLSRGFARPFFVGLSKRIEGERFHCRGRYARRAPFELSPYAV